MVLRIALVGMCLWWGGPVFSKAQGPRNGAVSPAVLRALTEHLQWGGRQRLHGQWQENQTWKGLLCEGRYQYQVALSAIAENVEINLAEQGYLTVEADLKALSADANGTFRSTRTACLPVGSRLNMAAPWGKLKTEIHFGESGDLSDLRIKIVSTELGRLDLGRWSPVWFEDFATGLLNRTASVVWNSWVGKWLSDKISIAIRDRLPDLMAQ